MPSFGFRTAGFRGWSVEDAAAELARLGYDCLELCLEAPDVRPQDLDAGRCTALRRTFDSLGLGIASLSYHGDVEPVEERRANQERSIQAAARLGAGIVVLNGEKTVDRERQWAEHVDRFRRLSALAQEAGVTIAVEPEPNLVISGSADMQDLLLAVGSPHLRVNFDLGHAQITDDDPAESLRRLGDAVVHLHLEDIRDRIHKHLLFGEGNIDFAAVRQALADIGYDGPYVADLFGLDDPRASAQQALAGLRARFA